MYGANASMVAAMLTPLARRVISRIRCLNRSKAFDAITRWTSGPVVKLNPRNFRSCGRATALFASFTLSLSLCVLLGHREHAQDAAHRDFPVIALQALAESADVLARLFATGEELPRGHRRLRGTIFVLDAVAAALLAQVLAQ